MWVARALEIALGVLLFGFFITQIVIPQVKGIAWFPIRNKFKRDLEKDLTKAHEELDDENLKKIIRGVEDEIKKRREPVKITPVEIIPQKPPQKASAKPTRGKK